MGWTQMQTPQAEPVRFSDLLTKGRLQVMWQVKIKTKNRSNYGEQIRNRHAGLRNYWQPKMGAGTDFKAEQREG